MVACYLIMGALLTVSRRQILERSGWLLEKRIKKIEGWKDRIY